MKVGDEIFAVDKTKVNETVDVTSLLAKAGETVHLSMQTDNVGRGKFMLYLVIIK